LFFHQSCPFRCFLPFSVLVWLSLVKTKWQITIIYVEEFGGLSKIWVSRSSYIRICIRMYLTQNIVVFVNTPMQNHDSWLGSDERKYRGYMNLWLPCCSHTVLRLWGQEGSVCFVTGDLNILLQGVYNLT
jgi:hypothetical protein